MPFLKPTGSRNEPEKLKKRKNSQSFKVNKRRLVDLGSQLNGDGTKSMSMISLAGTRGRNDHLGLQKRSGSNFWGGTRNNRSRRRQQVSKRKTKDEMKALAKSQFLDISRLRTRELNVRLGTTSPTAEEASESTKQGSQEDEKLVASGKSLQEAKSAATTKSP